METKAFIEQAFEELEDEHGKAMRGLTTVELSWQPNPQANSIGFIFWHMLRAEDFWVSGFAHSRITLFEKEGWPLKWGLHPKDTGYRYDVANLEAFNVPPIGELWEYHRQVRNQTLEFLRCLSSTDFHHKPDPTNPKQRGCTIGLMFSHLVCEIAQHVGHIWYIRGLQRGINK